MNRLVNAHATGFAAYSDRSGPEQAVHFKSALLGGASGKAGLVAPSGLH